MVAVPGLSCGSYERLTALDAAFLHAEGPCTPMHIGSVAVAEGAPFFDERGRFRLDEVRAQVASRLDRLPRFRRKLMWVPLGQGRPVWVDDPDFDVADHVDLVVLPSPGTHEMLVEVAERLQMQPLDRGRPLWSLTLVGGLEGGRVGMVQRVHHALVDGVSGVDAAAALLDLSPEVPPPPVSGPGSERAEHWEPAPGPAPLGLLAATLAQRATDPVEIARSARVVLRRPRRVLGDLRAVADTAINLTWRGLAPTTSLNAPVGRRRALLEVRRPLEDVRAAAHGAGGTINDAVLAAVAGGVRTLLQHRGEDVADRTLRVLVPVSVRSDDEHLALGNRVTMVVASLPIGVESAVGRLRAAQDEMGALKSGDTALGTELTLAGADHLPPLVTSAIARSVHRQRFVNVVVTNVPGPDCPLYFMGARILEATPVVPLGGNLTVGIAILSYDGALTIGVHADRDACPDAHVLADGIAATLDALAADAHPGTPASPT